MARFLNYKFSFFGRYKTMSLGPKGWVTVIGPACHESILVGSKLRKSVSSRRKGLQGSHQTT